MLFTASKTPQHSICGITFEKCWKIYCLTNHYIKIHIRPLHGFSRIKNIENIILDIPKPKPGFNEDFNHSCCPKSSSPHVKLPNFTFHSHCQTSETVVLKISSVFTDEIQSKPGLFEVLPPQRKTLNIQIIDKITIIIILIIRYWRKKGKFSTLIFLILFWNPPCPSVLDLLLYDDL